MAMGAAESKGHWQAVSGRCHGNTMAVSIVNCYLRSMSLRHVATAIALAWLCNGTAMVGHASAMALPWNAMGLAWRWHGGAIAVPWQGHG